VAPRLERTIPNLFDAAVEEAATRTWLLHDDREFTYEQARERVGTAAGALTGLGVGKGDLVLATMRNTPEYLFTWLALMRLGAILVAADPAGSANELAGLVRQTEPRLIVTDPGLHEVAGAALDALRPSARRVDVDTLFAGGAGDPAGTAGPRPEDPAVLIPTSGTTGRSKLVTQTHLAYVLAGEGFPWWLELGSEDRLMTSLPLFHINAPAYSVLGSVAARASLVLLRRFSASTFIDSARRYGATEFNAIGAMIEMLMLQPERPDDADNPLRLCYTGPSPTKERQLEIERRFGLRIVCGYALSETPYGMIWRRGTRPYGTLGSVRQHPTQGEVNEARVLVDGRPAAPGEVGELELRNPAVMKGYWGMPEETAKVLSPDGWLRTGDLVHANEDGTYTFIGRQKEIIRRRGENLAPAEVEEVLASHPDVVEAAVVGVPSELSEEEVKAFVVLRDPPAVTDPEVFRVIHSWLSERLTRFKVPRYLEAVTELPHTPTGRVAKHQLPRDRTPQEWDAEAAPAPTKGARR
jgi:crotonobetaine/carnitine-CoA ligase